MSPLPSPPQPAPTTLLFDLDDTLIDSSSFMIQLEFIARMVSIFAKKRGYKAAFRSLKESTDILKIPSHEKTNHERMVEVFENLLNVPKAEAEHQIVSAIQNVFPKLKTYFGKVPGASKFLDWAKDKYPLYLTTNPAWLKEFVELRMKWGGIDPSIFKSMTTSDRMHASKPSPEYYREVLKLEGLEPKQCLLIGNDKKMDLPATEVGIAVFLVRPRQKRIRTLKRSDSQFPGAWSGNYTHLRQLLDNSLNKK